jgi:acyl-CoA dehydrogenase
MTHERVATLFPFSERSRELQAAVAGFVADEILPAEATFQAHAADAQTRWTIPPLLETLKSKARAQGLWNLFLPDAAHGAGLSNLDYAPIAEITGRSLYAPEVFNCSAPDTGNMEVLLQFATPAQQAPWLPRLLSGEIRSAFAMTEPDVASSDATNIAMPILRDGDHFVLNGRKWWTTGAGDPRCELLIVMGVTDPDAPAHRRQSMVLVPMTTPGLRIVRPLTVFGYDDAPHGHVEIEFTDVRVPVANLLRDVGSGFEIAQARLGPGRIHHCMRLIGLAQRARSRSLRAPAGRARHGTGSHRAVALRDRAGAFAHFAGCGCAGCPRQ